MLRLVRLRLWPEWNLAPKLQAGEDDDDDDDDEEDDDDDEDSSGKQ